MKPLIFIILTLFLYTCKRIPTQLFGQNNAAWTESIYLRGFRPGSDLKISDSLIKTYANRLKAHGIRFAYLFAGPYQADGHLPDYPFSPLAKNTIKILKETYADIQILPWIGGIQNKTVYLGDSNWVANALADTKKLVDTLKVPGVHVDLEFIKQGEPFLDSTINKEKPNDLRSYGDNVNLFHKKLRLLMPDAFISSVVVATSPDTRPWKRKTTMPELSELIKYIDQLSFLYYDTQITEQSVFEKNCSILLEDIETLQHLRDIQFLVAIGSFVNHPALRKYRDLNIENIPNSIQTIKQSAIHVSDKKKIVSGISIFCDWETDENEWSEFDKYWSHIK